MDLEDLEEIQIRIEDRITEAKLKLSPLYISLSDEEDELDFSDIEEKYEEDRNGEDPYYSNPERSIVALELVAAGTVSNIGFAKDMYDVVRDAVSSMDPSSYHLDWSSNTVVHSRTRLMNMTSFWVTSNRRLYTASSVLSFF